MKSNLVDAVCSLCSKEHVIVLCICDCIVVDLSFVDQYNAVDEDCLSVIYNILLF